MKKDVYYTKEFFQDRNIDSVQSAKEIVPVVMDIIQPKSVVDVGCAIGAFLNVFEQNGISDILGIDGDYVDRKMLLIDEKFFKVHDLTQPFDAGRTFDLVVSLEVAEHLAPESADGFVDSLVLCGDVILFSAAIPHQGGTHHVNEQWPQYWLDKFEIKGYVAVDALRLRLWDNPQVSYWYAQNMFFLVKKERLMDFDKLRKIYDLDCDVPRALVHPNKLLSMQQDIDVLREQLENYSLNRVSFKKTLLSLPFLLQKAIKNRMKK